LKSVAKGREVSDVLGGGPKTKKIRKVGGRGKKRKVLGVLKRSKKSPEKKDNRGEWQEKCGRKWCKGNSKDDRQLQGSPRKVLGKSWKGRRSLFPEFKRSHRTVRNQEKTHKERR